MTRRLARTIRAMDSLTPVEFLSKLQKGNKPAPSDLAAFGGTHRRDGAIRPLCNALVFYVITTKDGQLPNKYAEKIAASLMRKGIETSLDAMNYFSAGKKNYPNPLKAKSGPPCLSKPVEEAARSMRNRWSSPKTNAISEAEFDDLMRQFIARRKEGK
jgi:replication initiation and membrane attachment protein DnaB